MVYLIFLKRFLNKMYILLFLSFLVVTYFKCINIKTMLSHFFLKNRKRVFLFLKCKYMLFDLLLIFQRLLKQKIFLRFFLCRRYYKTIHELIPYRFSLSLIFVNHIENQNCYKNVWISSILLLKWHLLPQYAIFSSNWMQSTFSKHLTSVVFVTCLKNENHVFFFKRE